MKSFLVAMMVMAAVMLLELGLCSTAQAQQKTEESFNGLFKQHDNAILKMVAVMHLRKEANDLRREKIIWAKGQVRQFYHLDIRTRFATEKEKAAVAKVIDAMEKNFDPEYLPAVYSDEIFPLLVAKSRGQEITNPSVFQKRMLAEVANIQSDGTKFFALTRAANTILNREYEAIDVVQEELQERILLFEALFKKRK